MAARRNASLFRAELNLYVFENVDEHVERNNKLLNRPLSTPFDRVNRNAVRFTTRNFAFTGIEQSPSPSLSVTSYKILSSLITFEFFYSFTEEIFVALYWGWLYFNLTSTYES